MFLQNHGNITESMSMLKWTLHMDNLVRITEFLCFIQCIPNCIRKHHAEIEIDRAIPTCLNERIKGKKHYVLSRHTDFLL